MTTTKADKIKYFPHSPPSPPNHNNNIPKQTNKTNTSPTQNRRIHASALSSLCRSVCFNICKCVVAGTNVGAVRHCVWLCPSCFIFVFHRSHTHGRQQTDVTVKRDARTQFTCWWYFQATPKIGSVSRESFFYYFLQKECIIVPRTSSRSHTIQKCLSRTTTTTTTTTTTATTIIMMMMMMMMIIIIMIIITIETI